VNPTDPQGPGFRSGLRPAEALRAKEPELERVFSRVETLGMKTMVNTGQTLFDLKKGLIRNDTSWKGFFPRGHILNQLSAALFTGFKKKFTPTDQGILGVTSDYDERINVRNTLKKSPSRKGRERSNRGNTSYSATPTLLVGVLRYF